MKTVQFHRNKEELRDELLLSLTRQDKSKHKYKHNKKSQSKQDDVVGIKSLSKQKIKKQIDNINNNFLHIHNQQSTQAPRIKLKLKKKTQCSTNKHPSIQIPATSKLSEQIKKTIQQQLLSSYYNPNNIDKNKQIDNRKTTYREDDEKDEESGIGERELSRKNQSSGMRTKDRQERCLKILEERNNKVINSFVEDNSKEEVVKKDDSLKRSINKFIPENQVYIPKSFITFTVRRNHHQQNEPKQHNILQPNNSLKNLLSSKESQNSQINTLNKRQLQNNRSLSNLPFHSQSEKQTYKKIAFYNRDKKSGQKGTSLKREIKESSIKRTESVKKIQTQEGLQIKQRRKKETRCVTEVEEMIVSEHVSEKNVKVPVRKQSQISRKGIQANRLDDYEIIKLDENKLVIPLVKMTESKYETKSNLSNPPIQHQQSISFTSSLNYSTPFPSVQHSGSKQLTINKLSTITKKSQQGLPLSPSPPKQEPLKFTEVKEQKKHDILRASLTKFKQYQKKKQEIEKQRPNIKVSLGKQKQPKVQLSNLKENEEFNDFEEIFLQAKDIDIYKSQIEQEKNKPKSQKTKIKKGIQPQTKQIQAQHQIEPNWKQFAKHPSVKQIDLSIKQSQKQQQTISQPQPLPVKCNHQLPQLSIQQSSIQKSVSDFTPQPSLADIRINDEPLLQVKQTKQQNQQQKLASEEKEIQQKKNEQQQQIHEKSELQIEKFGNYKVKQKVVAEEVRAHVDEAVQEVTSVKRSKSTTSKVRLIQNIELSSSSSESQSQDQPHKHPPLPISTQSNNNINKNHSEQIIQNRYYSSSDQQEQQKKKSQEAKVRKPKKLTLQKQNSMKKTTSSNQSKSTEKVELSKQKVIPLGIKINKPARDLFPVLQDSQEWKHGSQSVGEIERKSLNTPKPTFYQVLSPKDQTSILYRAKKSSQQKIKSDQSIIDKDQELDLLEKQFSQPGITRKSKQSMKTIVSREKNSKQNIDSLSDFSQISPNENSSSNATQELSDFSSQQIDHRQAGEMSIDSEKTPVQTYKINQQPLSNVNQLNQIQKERQIVHDLKLHVNSLLHKINSQHSISSHEDFVNQNSIDFNLMKSNEKNNRLSFITSQPSIKPVSMSHSGSLVDKQSFVEEYEQSNVRQSIGKSKNQKKSEISRQSSKAYKKYEKNDHQTNSKIETNPLFDFSDKNSSDYQRKNKVSSVKKYSQSSNESYGLSSKSISESQKNSQVPNKEEVLKQFENIAKQSQKDFSKNKNYYLKHKQSQKQKATDEFDEKIPILMPSKSTKSKQLTKEPYREDAMRNHESKTQKLDLSDGSSGQTINHRQLQVIPESLYITNAKNTSSTKIQPRDSLKSKKGLSVSKKLSSNSFDQEKSLSGFDKKSNNNDKSSSGMFNGSQSDHNQSNVVGSKRSEENQSLWNFIMKK